MCRRRLITATLLPRAVCASSLALSSSLERTSATSMRRMDGSHSNAGARMNGAHLIVFKGGQVHHADCHPRVHASIAYHWGARAQLDSSRSRDRTFNTHNSRNARSTPNLQQSCPCLWRSRGAPGPPACGAPPLARAGSRRHANDTSGGWSLPTGRLRCASAEQDERVSKETSRRALTGMSTRLFHDAGVYLRSCVLHDDVAPVASWDGLVSRASASNVLLPPPALVCNCRASSIVCAQTRRVSRLPSRRKRTSRVKETLTGYSPSDTAYGRQTSGAVPE